MTPRFFILGLSALLLYACKNDKGEPEEGELGTDTGEPGDLVFEVPEELEELDSEPNNSAAEATELPYGIADFVSVGGEDADWFLVDAQQSGSLRIWAWDATDRVNLTVEDEDGVAVEEIEGPGFSLELEIDSPQLIYLELTAENATELKLAVDFLPDPPRVDALESETVSVGDSLVIQGEGFGWDTDAVTVWLDQTPALLTWVEPTRIEAMVPYGATDSEVQVVVSGQRAEDTLALQVDHEAYPEFDAVDMDDLSLVEEEDGSLLVEGALSLFMEPSANQEAFESAVDAAGGDWEILYWSSIINAYELRYSDAPDADELEERRALIEDSDDVAAAILLVLPAANDGLAVDSDPFLDAATGSLPDGHQAYAGAHLAGAGDAQRLFNAVADQRHDPVRIAVLDTGVYGNGATNGPLTDQFTQHSSTQAGVRAFAWDAATARYQELATIASWVPTLGEDHGTLTAGLIGANNDQSRRDGGVSGLLAGFHAQGIDDDGDGSTDEAGESIRYQIDSYDVRSGLNFLDSMIALASGGYQVANVSMTIPRAAYGSSKSMAARLASPFTLSDTLWFVAAGNAGTTASLYWPAGQTRTNLVSVGAVGAYTTTNGGGTATADRRDIWNSAQSSNFGAPVLIVAPDRIHSTRIGAASSTNAQGYGEYGGTSCASPHAASLGALLRYLRPDLSARTIRDLIYLSGTDVSTRDTSWGVAARRIHWVKALTLPMFLSAWTDETDWEPYSWIAEQNATSSLWAITLDPATGLTDGVAWEMNPWSECDDPTDLQLSHDGLRIAAVCKSSDTVAMATTETGALISESYIGGDVGVRARGWVSPEGYYLATYQLSGQISLTAWDLTAGSLVWEDLVYGSNAYDLDIVETTWDAQQVVVLTSGNDAGELSLFDADPESHRWTQDTLYDGDMTTEYPNAQVSRGIARDPHSDRLTVVYSGTSTAEELVDIAVDSNGVPQPAADRGAYVRMDGAALERPYDIAFWPGITRSMAVVPTWESGRMALLEENSSESYPERWSTNATWIVSPSANPEKVDFLQNGKGVYMTSATEQTWSELSFDPGATGADKSFDGTYGGFNGMVGLDTSPLVAFVHPRPGSQRAGILEAVVLVRDPDAIKLSCRLNGSGSANSPADPQPGFWTCPPIDLDALSGDGVLAASIETSDGTTYDTTILIRSH